MERKRTIITLVLVAIAISASLYIMPALAHPYWAEEKGEEFVPPCLIDGEYENATYGYGPFHNETCPRYENWEEGGTEAPGFCWGNGRGQASGAGTQPGIASRSGQRARRGGYGGRGRSRGC
jgi:hypothetical protein